MKLITSVVTTLLAASLPLGAFAQAAPPQPGAFAQARDAARTAAFNDLTPDHRAQVQSIIDQVNAGTLSDLAGAAKQIDTILTPDENKAIQGERDTMVAAFRANHPEQSSNERAEAPHQPHAFDAGRFLLRLGLRHERMQALRAQHGWNGQH